MQSIRGRSGNSMGGFRPHLYLAKQWHSLSPSIANKSRFLDKLLGVVQRIRCAHGGPVEMTPALFLGLLFLATVSAQTNNNTYECVLGDVTGYAQDFPDINALGFESYQMTVEYTLPGAEQTDYYTEYYDYLNGMGRVESHQGGETMTYIYNTGTTEAWNIKGRKCQLNNITDTPDFFRDYQTGWTYEGDGDPSKRTVGPSAMFKNAWSRWNKQNNKRTMAFMGVLPHSHIRGLEARVWRWCPAANVTIDYYFTTQETENAYQIKTLPLRVTIRSFKKGEISELAEQSYDVINFQPFISLGLHPFQLPKGLGCGRVNFDDAPELPILETGAPVLFWAEVIYQKVKKSTREDLGSFYSKIMLAVDPLYGSIAYMTSPWNSTRVKGKDGEEDYDEFFQDAPIYLIYDTELGYGYKLNSGTGECEIGRGEDFTPLYSLPDKGGDVDLRNPYIFFPSSEFTYLTKGNERGLEVNVFEAVSEGYILNMQEQADKVIATHSYFTKEVTVDNEVSIQNAPVQTQLHIFRKKDSDLEEILTVNFYGYTTKFTSRRRRLFDVSPCFKNDDDYSWITIGFAFSGDKDNLLLDPTQVEERFVSELLDLDNLQITPSRIPNILVDIEDSVVVTFRLLEKPPIMLDFPLMEPNKKLDSTEQVLMNLEDCAAACLQSIDCWGFSMCGSMCVKGEGKKVSQIVTDKDCSLYRRYKNDTYMWPKSAIINALKAQVSDNVGLKLTVVNKKTDQEVDLKAEFIQEKNPAEDEETFEKMGNILSGRMQVKKVGKKLKKESGKSLGKLGFDECQRLCLDYEDCETLSYCLLDSACIISPKYWEEIKETDHEPDSYCQLVTRTYTDHFDISPGYFMLTSAKKAIKVEDAEACARACIKETEFKCLAVDMCADDASGKNCFLHTSHFLKQSTRIDKLGTRASCIHHSKKYSVEFQKHIQTRVKGTKVAAITNLNVEECAKQCVDYGQGSCYGFDFCQGKSTGDSSCIIIDTDPSRLENSYSAVCTQYLRDAAAYAPRPYTNSYSAGIGFLCFLIGGLVGAVVVFGIAYKWVNRQ